MDLKKKTRNIVSRMEKIYSHKGHAQHNQMPNRATYHHDWCARSQASPHSRGLSPEATASLTDKIILSITKMKSRVTSILVLIFQFYSNYQFDRSECIEETTSN